MNKISITIISVLVVLVVLFLLLRSCEPEKEKVTTTYSEGTLFRALHPDKKPDTTRQEPTKPKPKKSTKKKLAKIPALIIPADSVNPDVIRLNSLVDSLRSVIEVSGVLTTNYYSDSARFGKRQLITNETVSGFIMSRQQTCIGCEADSVVRVDTVRITKTEPDKPINSVKKMGLSFGAGFVIGFSVGLMAK